MVVVCISASVYSAMLYRTSGEKETDINPEFQKEKADNPFTN